MRLLWGEGASRPGGRTRYRSEERRVGKSVVGCVDLGGRRIIKKKKKPAAYLRVAERLSGEHQHVAFPRGQLEATGRFSFFFFKQKTAYEITYGDWSSDVCSSD